MQNVEKQSKRVAFKAPHLLKIGFNIKEDRSVISR